MMCVLCGHSHYDDCHPKHRWTWLIRSFSTDCRRADRAAEIARRIWMASR